MNLLLPLLVCLVGTAASADVIHLRDGSRVEGELRKTEEGYRVTGPTGVTTVVPADKVESIEIKPMATAETSVARLASLRRSVEGLSDLKTIIDRYEAFIKANGGTRAADDARTDLDAWRDRQSRGMVKLGTRWVDAAEAAALSRRSTDVAIALRSSIKQGRLKEAGAVAEKALADDPANISLLYLKGVLLYRQEELPGSRKCFEAVIASAPDHAPTLNNLAVIMSRQNAAVASLGEYDKAMLAAPMRREILDNVAEALNALPEAQRKSPIVTKVVRHFKEQDADLQKLMAEKGFVRWGSTFVSDAQADKLAAAEKQVKDQMDQMSRDFDALQSRITQIDRIIQSDQQELRLIDMETLQSDASGRIIRLPYPARYYDLGREINMLQAERQEHVSEQERLRRNAHSVQQKLPVARYTGIQKIIDVDGMPVKDQDLPATQPTTAPALPAPAK